MGQGRIVMIMANSPVALAATKRFLCLARRIQSHKPRKGAIAKITGLVRAAKPKSTPKPAHAAKPSWDWRKRAKRKRIARSKAKKEWYHIVVAEMLMAYGKKA